MCGFAAVFSYLNSGPVDSDVLARMSRRLAPRGPDGDGAWTDDVAGIGLVRDIRLTDENNVSPHAYLLGCLDDYLTKGDNS